MKNIESQVNMDAGVNGGLKSGFVGCNNEPDSNYEAVTIPEAYTLAMQDRLTMCRDSSAQKLNNGPYEIDTNEQDYNQILQWVNGISEHNCESNKCVPDFSCCVPELLSSKEDREQFMEACKTKDSKYIMGASHFFMSKLEMYNFASKMQRKNV